MVLFFELLYSLRLYCFARVCLVIRLVTCVVNLLLLMFRCVEVCCNDCGFVAGCLCLISAFICLV